MPKYLIIFSAPSGSGKTSIIKELIRRGMPLEFSVSATTRPVRGEEKHGADYFYYSNDEFVERMNNNEFVEWEEVYEGRFYGTLKSELERIWASNKNVVFDVDVVGGLNLKKIFAEKALAIFVQPPSVEVLKKRLESRSTDSKEDIEDRILKAEEELAYASEFDYIVVNDDFEKAVSEAERLILDFTMNA